MGTQFVPISHLEGRAKVLYYYPIKPFMTKTKQKNQIEDGREKSDSLLF